ncbi:MAG: uroporphyrinogen decarboxylase family protein [Bacteroidota bacterium]|nr:uroporphyrinogen decarboxylase family protein [Bacteroidota bacterium]
MNSKERFIATLEHRPTDRLPVTTHHLMPSFLKNYLNGASNMEFFEQFGLDPIDWQMAYTFDPNRGEYYDPEHTEMGFLEARRVISDEWVIKIEKLEGQNYPSQRFEIITPEKTLSMILQSDQHSTWVVKHLLKEKQDIDIIAKYMTFPLCDVDHINQKAGAFGNKGLVRGHIMAFEGFGQPGCWQDAACLFGIEKLIMATFEDPQWVHAFLKILYERKKVYVDSLKGAKYDILELGGGDASTTVISPDIFDDFVAPYDSSLIKAAHQAGQRISYHTCGGMMPILENIAAMKPDAMETFTPAGMGADVDLAEAKRRIGEKVCMIGGFDQFHFLKDCTEEETRAEVRRCFEAAGQGGGFILSPSDHFFDADLNLIQAFADEGRSCVYND